MPDLFTWVHISDVHLRVSLPFAQELMFRDLLACVGEKSRFPFGQVNALFVTGDLAHSGEAEEYKDQVLPCLDRLVEALGIARRRVYIVPGNHDADWAKIKPFHKIGVPSSLALHSDEAVEASDEIFTDQRTLGLLGEKFEAFKMLAETYPNAWRDGRYPYFVRVLAFDGFRVGVVGLNTAWFVRKDDKNEADKGNLLLGRRLMDSALSELETRRADLTFVLMHHPLEWLCEWEGSDVLGRLMARADVVLAGHLHKPKGIHLTESEKNKVIFAHAGTLYDGATWPRSFYVGEWKPLAGKIKLHRFVHKDPSGNDRWRRDGDDEFDVRKAKPVADRRAARSRDITLGEIAPEATWGSRVPPNGCVYLQGDDETLKHIESVTYRCRGGEYDGQTWVNRAEGERFAQTFPVKDQPVVIKAIVRFDDGSERTLESDPFELPGGWGP